ncbi:MAG: TolC family protein [Bacteroidota bacterium]
MLFPPLRYARTLLMACALAALGAPYSVAQEKPIYDIGILVDFDSPELAPLLAQMKQEITAVVGEDATVRFPETSFLVNTFSAAQAEAHYQTLLADETDIILAFGPTNNGVIANQPAYPKPTILFGAVNRDVVQLADTSTTSGIDNFTYLISAQSYRRDLEALQSLYAFERVAVVAAGPAALTATLQAPMAAIFADLGADFALLPYTTLDGLLPQLGGFDALYLAEGFNIPTAERSALGAHLKEIGMPSFTSTRREDVLNGWMATNEADESFDQFFRRIALSVEAVINGENLGALPVFIDTSDQLTLNFNTVEQVGVALRYSLMARIDLVGDFDDFAAERTYTLIEVIDDALANNLSLAATRQNVALADQEVRAARSNYLPSVTASATGTHLDPKVARASNGQNPEYSTSGDVTVSQTIYSDAASANIRIQRALREAEVENVQTQALDLVLDAASAYFNVLILKANLRIRKENLDVTKRNLQIAEQNLALGQTGQTDVLRFRSQMAQNMQALIEAINQVEGSIQTLNLLLNNPIDRKINVADAVLSERTLEDYDYEQIRLLIDDPDRRLVFEEFLVSEAMQNAPELRILDYNLEVVQRNILLNGPRRFIPTVGAQAQYNRTFEQWGDGALPDDLLLRDSYNVGVNLSIPLFDGNRFAINRQTAQIQQQQLELNRAATQQVLERNVRAGVLDLINQISNIELSGVSEEAAEQSLSLTETLYATGAVTVVQLIDAQANYLQAQLASANATYTYLLSATTLERAMGYYFLLRTDAENTAFLQRFEAFQAERAAER